MTSIAIDDLIAEGEEVAQPPVATQTIINRLNPFAFFQTVKSSAAVAVTAATVAVAATSVVVATAVRDIIVSAFGEEALAVGIMPPSTTGFMINTLLSFTQIKSQGKPEFPFETHPQLMKVLVTSLLIYGLASVAEHVISRTGFNPVYPVSARYGRIGSLLVIIASLAALFFL